MHTHKLAQSTTTTCTPAACRFLQLTIEELKAPLKAECTMHVGAPGPVQAFCGYFDVDFRGSDENPADNDIRLSTAPDATGELKECSSGTAHFVNEYP